MGAAAWTLAASGMFAGPVPLPSTLTGAPVDADSWALPGRDSAHTSALPQHDGYALSEAWRRELPSPPSAAPAVAGGRIILPTEDARLLALDARDGAPAWERALPLPADAAPAVTSGAVLVASRSGDLLALDPQTGAERWTFRADGPLLAAPVVHDGAVYAATWDGVLSVLDVEDGRLLWTLDVGDNVVAPPALDGGAMALATDDGLVLVLDLATGRPALTFDAAQSLAAPPALADGLALVVTGRGRLLAIDTEARELPLERGARFWRRQLFFWGLQSEPPVQKGLVWERRPSRDVALSAPVLLDGAAYAASRDGRLHAFALADGAPLWTYDSGAPTRAAPVGAGPYVYLGNDAGELHAVDRRTGTAHRVVNAGGAVTGLAATRSALYVAASNPPALIALR